MSLEGLLETRGAMVSLLPQAPNARVLSTSPHSRTLSHCLKARPATAAPILGSHFPN